jgi:Ca2+-binding RTX toxin-like protein
MSALGSDGNDYSYQSGGTGIDIMTADGSAGDDIVIVDGGPGNDAITYNVSDGADYVFIDGGMGNDTLTINATSQNFTVLNMKGEVLYQQGAGDSVIWIRSVENITVVAPDVEGVLYQVTDPSDTTGGPDTSDREVGLGKAFVAMFDTLSSYLLHLPLILRQD